MTAEEIEIIVTARVEEALKEFKKIVPAIKEQLKQIQESFSKVNVKNMQNKVQQAVQIVKKRLQDFRKSNTNNEIAIKVNNKEAEKQITQLQKQIDSLNEKINARRMKLNVITPKLDEIANEPYYKVSPNKLSDNKQYVNLSDKEQMATQEIEYYSQKIIKAKAKMKELESQISQTASSQSKLSGFLGIFKQKVEQVKPSVASIKNNFKGLPKITQNITSNVQGMGKSIKQGLGHILRYALALFSLRGIYSILSNCASSWLSSQNAGAKQLSANIEYMKYAMGSALAPIIQFVTNLVYQLMKAVQSVAYALTGVNIFANASAKSYEKMAGSAKKAKNETKQLAGVHNEINNISSSNGDSGSESGGTNPSFDLSQMDNTPNSIIDAIKNGNWYEVGATIGQKLNEAMASIPWDKIQDGARNIGNNIAQFLNGFIATTNWYEVGNTFAQGLNTVIYFGYNLINTFNWKQFGKAISDQVNGFFDNVDWKTAGKTLGNGIKGAFTTIYTAIEGIDWRQIAKKLQDFVKNIDWSGIIQAMFRGIGAALGGATAFLATLIGDVIQSVKGYFQTKIEEAGGNIVQGIFKGIIDAIAGIGNWIYSNIFKPFIDGFKNAFGIHSPSTVMMQMGGYLIDGFKNGIKGIWGKVKQIFTDLKNNIGTKFKETVSKIKDNFKISTIRSHFKNVVSTIKSVFSSIPDWFKGKFSKAWNNVKNVFSKGGKVFSGIKDGIASTFKKIVNSLITGINKVIKVPFDKINSALNTIKNVNILGARPFSGLPTINVPQIPKLAKGNVAYEKTLAIFGEYSGASNNPEITAPKNVMYETMRSALDDADLGNNNDRPIYLTVNVGNQRLGQILLDELKDKRRRTGKGIEALVGG